MRILNGRKGKDQNTGQYAFVKNRVLVLLTYDTIDKWNVFNDNLCKALDIQDIENCTREYRFLLLNLNKT